MKKIKLDFFKKVDISDVFIFIGGFGIAFGIWQIYPPAAYIFAGAGFLFMGMFGGNKKSGG